MHTVAIMFLILLIVTPIALFGLLVFQMVRLRYFSELVADCIDFRYTISGTCYLASTNAKIVFVNPNRKKINVDVSASYANFSKSNIFDWDFHAMIVEEQK